MSEIHEEPEAVTEPAPSPEPLQLPGRFLREAREARSLAVFEVAQSLKFSPRQIEALEADDYAVLPPGATFLRGFVRGYAKLLKVDSEPLLAMLDARAPVALPDVRAPQNMGVAATPVASGRHSSLPLLLGAALLAALALALGVWHFLGGESPPPPAAQRAPEPPAADTALLTPPSIRIEETPEATPPAAPAVAPNPANTRQLVFVFGDKSWVEVKDAGHRVILAGEYAADTRQAVAGRPPFQIVVGNAAKVELQYEDREIDLKPHTRAEVARLTLE